MAEKKTKKEEKIVEEKVKEAKVEEIKEEKVVSEESPAEEDSTEESSSEEEKTEEEPEKKIEVDNQQYVHKQVSSITFGTLSPDILKKMASAKIVTPELYDREGYPVDGGLMDIRLGVIDPGLKCKTCGSKLKECIGHFGYIELARPIIHIKFISIILNILRSTCRDCGRVLIP